MLNDETTITALVLAACLSLIAALVTIEKRKRTDLRPSLIPTTPIMLVAGLGALLALVHLLNQLGVHTGR